MFRPADNRARLVQLRDLWFLTPVVLVVSIVALQGCGPKRVRMTIPELRALEQCVIDADDQVERQNCVERLIPRDAQ